MYFSSIALRNFGPFGEKTFRFEPLGINWLMGANASGKTQLAGAILAVFIGKPALTIAHGGVGPTQVQLQLQDGAQAETVELTVTESPTGKIDVVKSQGTLALSVIAAMAQGAGQRLLLDDDAPSKPVDDVAAIDAALPDGLRLHPTWLALKADFGSRGALHSQGQQQMLALAEQGAARFRAAYKIPLVVDAFLATWSDGPGSFAAALLEEIAKVAQVIVLSSQALLPTGSSIHAISGDTGLNSLAYFNSFYHQRPPSRAGVGQRQQLWVRGAQFPTPESRVCELKEVKGANPVGSIKSVVDHYAVAFLNANPPEGGSIFWGVRDEDRVIVGVVLPPKERDDLCRVVIDKLHRIQPAIAPSAYRIFFHELSDGRQALKDQYVVEVRVPPQRRTFLYATGSDEVYLKTDSGKRRLAIIELQQELALRLGADLGL